ncbi:MAG: choice-of-anchor J domain-containing protein [Bacteroidales bacterium]|nr:choice-of-anchor J domain-containing protein [Bacteroidales bacterium]
MRSTTLFRRYCLIALFAILTLVVRANPVDLVTAHEVGAKFLNAYTTLKTDDPNALQLVSTYNTANNEVAFYIFNISNGFVIVSGNDCAIPILGYSDEGQFDIRNIPPQLEEYLQDFVDQIQYGIDNHLETDEETMRQWVSVKATGRLGDDRGMATVEPLVTALWGQGCNYNSLCPVDNTDPDYCGHALVGCVAVAMGQIMHYWGRPTTGTGSHSYVPSTHPEYGTQSANFGATTYNWNNMPNSLSGSPTTAQINAVATLLYHCGVSVNMNYGNVTYNGGSGAYSSDVPSALMNYFSYSSDMQMIYKSSASGWLAQIKASLDMGCPVFFSGQDTGGQGGHAFICDGYNSSNMLHINWGWSGNNNAFYADGALNASGYQFNANNSAIVNIHPVVTPGVSYQVTATASPATGGTVSGSGSYQAYQTCTLNATPASGYSFIGWKEGSTMVSTNPSYSFVVKQNRTLTAVFGLPPVGSVTASYYPNPNDPNSSATQVTWVPVSSQTWSFDNGFEGWTTIDADGDGHNWMRASVLMSGYSFNPHGGSDMLCSQSYDNTVGVLTPNNYLVSPQVSLGGVISFWACAQDANYAAEHFGVAVSTTGNTSATAFTTIQEWTLTSKGVPGQTPRNTRSQGNWYQFTVDLGNYAGQTGYVAIRHFNCTDMFYIDIDDVEISNGAGYYPAQNSLSEGFELGIPSDWMLIDADGDGYQWEASTNPGHNGGACVSSASYINNVGALTPDNYLVSPQIALGGMFSFWACAQDANYAAEHFGVAVSTTTNTSASAFTVVQQWTLTAKEEPYNGPRGAKTQGNWHQYTVNLSSYAGQTGYIAIRHFNCTDMFYLNVDDVQYGFGKENPQIVYYRVYRSTCGNTSTVQVADQLTGTSYIDNTWGTLPLGSYKFGICSVGTSGNESQIVWSNCLDRGVGYTITATANPAAGGVITGAGLYEQGTSCTLTATPNTGYTFVNWTCNGNVVSSNTSYSFTVTNDATYVANFTPNNYNITVTANPTAGGTVTGAGTYIHGATATLTATANTGYTFVNWTKNGAMVSTNPNYTFTVTEGGNYIATFSLNSYDIAAVANPIQGGTVSGAGTYNHGATATLTATANTGYTFVNWTKNGTQVSTNATYSFTVTEAGTYMANFNANSCQITAIADPMTGGTVSGGGTYSYNETCTLTATANAGYHFLNWSLDGVPVSSNTTYSFTVTGNASYVAHFSEEMVYTVITVANPEDGGAVSGSGTYNEGETCTITAIANTGYTFLNWSKDGTVVSTNSSYSFTVVESGTYVANFNANTYVVTVSANPTESGVVTGQGTYQHGSMVTVSVTPNPHYYLEHWTMNGYAVSEELSYTFEVTGDCQMVAHLYYYDGLDENNAVKMTVYPNPSSDVFNIQCEGINRIEVLNIYGQVIVSDEVRADACRVDLSDCPAGTYMLRVFTDSGVLTKNIIRK